MVALKNDRLVTAMEVLVANDDDVGLTAIELGVSTPTLCRYMREAQKRKLIKKGRNNAIELLTANVDLAMQKQKAQDTNRIERKTFREHARVSNAISEYGSEICKLLKTHSSVFKKKLPKSKPNKVIFGDEVGVLQISDPHFNELVDLPHNQYDFKVASARLKKLVNEAKFTFKSRGIGKVLVAITGDLLNSDRRLDELLSQATNRAKATMLAVDLLKYVLLDLTEDFQVDVVSVLGNESRADQDMTYGDDVLSNNFDFTIVSILDRLLVDNKRIKFLSYDTVEQIVEIGVKKLWKKNLLVTHDFSGQSNKQKDTQATIGRYIMQQDIKIDYVMCGHIHAMHNGDWVSRSASLAGANAYSDKKLNLAGKASQNIFIFGKNTKLVIGVDLQDVDRRAESYPIDETLEAYNAKSINKTKKEQTVHKIITII